MDNPLLVQAARRTSFIKNPEGDGELHPGQTVRRFAPAADPLGAVEMFEEFLREENVCDEGDWKRDVTAGLYQLHEELASEPVWVLRTLERMLELVNWTYREDLEGLRRELLRRAEGIGKGLLKKQPGT